MPPSAFVMSTSRDGNRDCDGLFSRDYCRSIEKNGFSEIQRDVNTWILRVLRRTHESERARKFANGFCPNQGIAVSHQAIRGGRSRRSRSGAETLTDELFSKCIPTSLFIAVALIKTTNSLKPNRSICTGRFFAGAKGACRHEGPEQPCFGSFDPSRFGFTERSEISVECPYK